VWITFAAACFSLFGAFFLGAYIQAEGSERAGIPAWFAWAIGGVSFLAAGSSVGDFLLTRLARRGASESAAETVPPPRSVEQRLATLTAELNRSMMAIASIRAELDRDVTATQAELDRFQHDIETYKPLDEASRSQAEAFMRVWQTEVSAGVRAEMSTEARRSAWTQLWMQVALGALVFLLGTVTTSILLRTS
jgi:hypothetical protein